MARGPRRPLDQSKIEELARRRAGANYNDASFAVWDRLEKLKADYNQAPPSYQGYLAVGICSCLESHIKYCYAHAAERFSEHTDLLRKLFKDITVDIDTLISTTSRTFGLADVVAASISVSSLDAFLERSNHFLSVLAGRSEDFPWSYLNFVTGGDPSLKKETAERLDRLRLVFDARHKFVHETSVLDEEMLGPNPIDYVDDAMVLLSQFQKQLGDIEMSDKYAVIRYDEGLPDAVDRRVAEIDVAFDNIKASSDARQHMRLEEFRKAFKDYLWARCSFQASVFVAQQSESAMSFFLNTAPEYREMLKDIGQKNKFMAAQYPLSVQYVEMGLNPDGTDSEN
jgi:hypothetical protein